MREIIGRERERERERIRESDRERDEKEREGGRERKRDMREWKGKFQLYMYKIDLWRNVEDRAENIYEKREREREREREKGLD